MKTFLAIALVLLVASSTEAGKKCKRKLQAANDEIAALKAQLENCNVAPTAAPTPEPTPEPTPTPVDYTCGGNGGGAFSDASYSSAIRGLAISDIGSYCSGIKVKYTSGWGPQRGPTGSNTATVEFADDEYLTRVEVGRIASAAAYICQLTLTTNKGVYGPYCNANCNTGGCGESTTGGFKYVSGRTGAWMDSLNFHA